MFWSDALFGGWFSQKASHGLTNPWLWICANGNDPLSPLADRVGPWLSPFSPGEKEGFKGTKTFGGHSSGRKDLCKKETAMLWEGSPHNHYSEDFGREHDAKTEPGVLLSSPEELGITRIICNQRLLIGFGQLSSFTMQVLAKCVCNSMIWRASSA